MPQFKIAAVLALAIILQLSLREAWPPLSHIDFPLIVVVYVALQRDAWTALIVGTIAGLAIDTPSGGLIGAGGFSKTLTAYLIYLGATRINLVLKFSLACQEFVHFIRIFINFRQAEAFIYFFIFF